MRGLRVAGRRGRRSAGPGGRTLGCGRTADGPRHVAGCLRLGRSARTAGCRGGGCGVARDGRMVGPGIRWYSMAGMMATWAARVRRASGHCEGRVKERSYLPRKGPWVKRRTSGAVLRYRTTEMRSLLTLVVRSRKRKYSRRDFAAVNSGALKRSKRLQVKLTSSASRRRLLLLVRYYGESEL